MATVRVVLKGDWMRQLARSAALESMLDQRAERVRSAAVTRSPVASGRYRASFRIEHATTDRPVVRVRNTVAYATRVEFGGYRMPAYRPLGGALDAAGS
jgi:diadenosine tetraphosphatase ApaH/serine/threonine PP2A family protein phosphatase